MTQQPYNPAVRASRKEPPDSLEFFPTPPWATRALMHHVIGTHWNQASVWEPAAGEGHMAEVLKEYFGNVHASDVHDYGAGYQVGSFVGGFDAITTPIGGVDFVISNPPFAKAVEFVERGLKVASDGVAMLLRTAWLESTGRYEDVFKHRAPSQVAIFSERVPMHKGRWEPDGASMTSYAWFVWRHIRRRETELLWIPPGQRTALEKSDDRARFAKRDVDTQQPDMLAAPDARGDAECGHPKAQGEVT